MTDSLRAQTGAVGCARSVPAVRHFHAAGVPGAAAGAALRAAGSHGATQHLGTLSISIYTCVHKYIFIYIFFFSQEGHLM